MLTTLNNDNTETFQMIEGVDMFGGFDPDIGDDEHAERDPDNNETILNGDQDQSSTKNNSDALHVVKGADATIDGFSIVRGNAIGVNYDDYFGAGMFNSGVNPTVNNCKFDGNTSVLGGGGMYNLNASTTVTGCTFSYNIVTSTANVGHGGGIYNNGNSSSTISNCTFLNNNVGIHGGGLYNSTNSSYTLNVTNCTFTENTSIGDGGGVKITAGTSYFSRCSFIGNVGRDGGGGSGGDVTFNNCVFLNNSSTGTLGGGGYYSYYSSPQFKHCTFKSNSANNVGDGILNDNGSPIFTNSILWGTDDQVVNWGPSTAITYSDVQMATGII